MKEKFFRFPLLLTEGERRNLKKQAADQGLSCCEYIREFIRSNKATPVGRRYSRHVLGTMLIRIGEKFGIDEVEAIKKKFAIPDDLLTTQVPYGLITKACKYCERLTDGAL